MRREWTWTGKSLPSKKNSKILTVNEETGKPLILPGGWYADWEKRFVLEIRSLGYGIGRYKSAVFTFYAPNKRRWDLSNKLESIHDGLVKAGYLEDDDVDHCPDVRIVYGGVHPQKIWAVIAEIEV